VIIREPRQTGIIFASISNVQPGGYPDSFNGMRPPGRLILLDGSKSWKMELFDTLDEARSWLFEQGNLGVIESRDLDSGETILLEIRSP
jgi:hypothetical protein